MKLKPRSWSHFTKYKIYSQPEKWQYMGQAYEVGCYDLGAINCYVEDLGFKLPIWLISDWSYVSYEILGPDHLWSIVNLDQPFQGQT